MRHCVYTNSLIMSICYPMASGETEALLPHYKKFNISKYAQ